jgi:hypothetical protein
MSGGRLLVAGHRPADSAPRTPSRLLLASYRDLNPVPKAPEHARNVVLSYQEYLAGVTGMYLRRHQAGAVRLLLCLESPQEFPGPDDPRHVPGDQRSARWTELCTGLDGFRSADLPGQTALLGLCSALGYFGVTARLGLGLAREMLSCEGPLTDEQSSLLVLVAGSVVRTTTARLRRPLLEFLLGAVRQRAPAAQRLLAQAYYVAYLTWSGSAGEAGAESDALVRELSARPVPGGPVTALASLACGWAAARRGEVTLARDRFDEASDQTEDPGIRRSAAEARAVLSFRLGDAARAAEEHWPVVRADPLDAEAWAERGVLLEVTDPQAALASYRQALRLGVPVTGFVSERLGDLLADMGDLAGAFDAYASAAAIAAGPASALAKLARAAEEIGQPEIARWAHEQVPSPGEAAADQVLASIGTFPPSPVLELPGRGTERQ